MPGRVTCIRRGFALAALCLAAAACKRGEPSGAAPRGAAIRVGVLTDLSGLYADLAGEGSVIAAQLAVEDVGGKVGELPVEVLSADHRNKPDVGSNLARQWFEADGVDVIVDVPTSSVALAVSELARQKDKVLLVSGAGTLELTGKGCSPNTVHWTYDTYALANGTGKAVVKAGGDSWFFLTADYAFGQALERDTAAVVRASGGKVLGSVKHPLNTSDFSSFILQAQASKAKVVGLANAGGDVINAIKSASEFALTQGGQKLAGLLVFISDIHALGLQTAQGLNLTTAYYWDRDEGTRAFARRFAARAKGAMPTMVQAGVYGATLHYLKARAALGPAPSGRAVVAKMRELPSEDAVFGRGSIRPDGVHLHPMYLYEVKRPSESTGPWDYFTLLRELPAEEAFQPLEQSACPLLRAPAP